ncbi:hypothetical protein TPHA_0A02810 [Tetrapisispora phaffii CBS 4417]|uniref:J domain-containing protein n=1 Tax=Tetrapisispora phaffii (strain ATCC 24235 / CBS 4417 / NBRC 1672 / NRRL Y-8282 / UCD 70-5) TaxID=1071381 RepID=G8BN84_TETPH|nr:hypothetical protein TPHA_0A02810 [Tetrapisispora phaffii CBS 4417]CCE61362.1 hypothetical protein TPHA_0A02810 [Tetrapisispora phaffii CBS 4417]
MEIDKTTHYSVLGLTPTASLNDIKKSYKKLARELHPDKSKSNESSELFKIVVDAYSILSDVKEREEYNITLHRKGLYTNYKQSNNDKKTSNTVNKSKESNTQHTEDKRGGDKNSNKNTVRKSKPYEQQPYGFGPYVDNLVNEKDKPETTQDLKEDLKRNTTKNETESKHEHADKIAKQESTATKNTKSDSKIDEPFNNIKENPKLRKLSDLDNTADERSPKPKKKTRSGAEKATQKASKVKPTGQCNIRRPQIYPYSDKSSSFDSLDDLGIKQIRQELHKINLQDQNGNNLHPKMDNMNSNNFKLNSDDAHKHEFQEVRTKRKKSNSIKLTELESVLPKIGDVTFDMNDIRRSLMESPVSKKLKIEKHNFDSILSELNTSLNSNEEFKHLSNLTVPTFELSLNDNSIINKEYEVNKFKNYIHNSNRLKSNIISKMNSRLLNDLNSNINNIFEQDMNFREAFQDKYSDVELSNILHDINKKQHDAFVKIYQII